MIETIIKGFTVGIAYVAPIGMQNMFPRYNSKCI